MQAKTLAAAALAAWRLQEAGQKLLSKLEKPKSRAKASGTKVDPALRQSQAKNTRAADKRPAKADKAQETGKRKGPEKSSEPSGRSKKASTKAEAQPARMTRSRAR